ncbi:hypothetical protein JJE62_05490 [Alloprevotella tannerae]|uniref:hypothetical protein n=1 Tax=Alloprevotella tannerae TaxID=76122 RepID=UPI001EDC4355|nr:hypothetical protein [Alloprevotella tannerae]MCG2646909.1 hypothetical protein [Alloprevotella tannerae]
MRRKYLLTTKFYFSTFRLVNNQHQVVKELAYEESQTIFVEKEARLKEFDSSIMLQQQRFQDPLAGSAEMLTFALARARSALGLIIHLLNLYHND